MKSPVLLPLLLLPLFACQTTPQASRAETAEPTQPEGAQIQSASPRAVSSPPPGTTLEQMSADQLAQMFVDEPARAIDLLWYGIDLAGSTNVTLWCLHQIGVNDPEPCRQFVKGHAATMLDLSAFGEPATVVDYFRSGNQSMSGRELAQALLPHMQAQYSGGFGDKLGRMLNKHRVRANMLQKHSRLQATHRSVQTWVQERPQAVVPESGEAVLVLLLEDPEAFTALVFGAGSAMALQQLLVGLSASDIDTARSRLSEASGRLLSIEADARLLLARAPAEDAESVLYWLIRSMAKAAGRPDGSLQSEVFSESTSRFRR